MIQNAPCQRKNTNMRLKHYQKIWTLLSRVFLMTARLLRKYILTMNRLKLHLPKGVHYD